MIGHGVYFARSREGTEGKANHRGAFICAEIDTGRVLKLGPRDRNLHRGKKDWWYKYDTAYYCHEDPRKDEFCVKSPNQILNWIMVIGEGYDTKVMTYGLQEEFGDVDVSKNEKPHELATIPLHCLYLCFFRLNFYSFIFIIIDF